MPVRSTHPARPRARLAAVLAALSCGTLVHANDATLEETSCMLTCKTGQSCAVLREGHGPTPVLNAERFTAAGNCQALKVTATGEVVLRYRHKGRWFDPPMTASSERPPRQLFDQYKPDPCGVPTRSCLQQRMAAKAASTAGHGVDSLGSAPAGTGDPCVLGLPCGTVLPPPAEWRFRLADGSLNGRLQLRYRRGNPPTGMPAEVSGEVKGGEVLVDGSFLQPAASIGYRLTDAGGTLRASGEFEVAGSARVNRLKAAVSAAAQRNGLTESAAWMDALAAQELDWDLQQLLAPK